MSPAGPTPAGPTPAGPAAMDPVAALLLCDPSPAVRHQVLTELLGLPPDDPEVADLDRRRRAAPEVAELLATGGDDPRALAWALCRLAWLGVGREEPRVGRLAERVFAGQRPDGSFPLPAATRGRGRGRKGLEGEGRYTMAPLQTALPLRGLAAAGFATDPRAERAYEWLLGTRLDDGAWPMGIAAGQPGYIAGYRKLPGSRGCRATTQGALACLVLHPERRRSDATRLALDLLLQRETRDEWALGSEVARLAGVERPAGFVTFYARFDLAFLLDLAGRAGAADSDARVGALVEFLLARRGPNGLWAHPSHPELTRWLTLDLLRGLARVRGGDWEGIAPRVPFRAYPARRRRY
jgi:hypothetical protein